MVIKGCTFAAVFCQKWPSDDPSLLLPEIPAVTGPSIHVVSKKQLRTKVRLADTIPSLVLRTYAPKDIAGPRAKLFTVVTLVFTWQGRTFPRCSLLTKSKASSKLLPNQSTFNDQQDYGSYHPIKWHLSPASHSLLHQWPSFHHGSDFPWWFHDVQLSLQLLSKWSKPCLYVARSRQHSGISR